MKRICELPVIFQQTLLVVIHCIFHLSVNILCLCWGVVEAHFFPPVFQTSGQNFTPSFLENIMYGFNWELSSEQLSKVNLMRENSHYIDERAAIIKRGKTNKKDLTSSPFTRNLHYGAMNEGYWTYEDMILQVEDCIDCLKALNGQQYEYLFMFDHSNGHDRVSPDALSPTAISKNYGGVQPFMRDSVITDSSFLGPYNHPGKLKVGDVQSMSFSHTDVGPFYLREKEREERKFDKITGTKKKQLVNTELVDKLKDVGIKNPKGKKSKLLKLCKMNNTNTVHTVVETTQGWVNKQKGAFQVLYERGWINPSIPFNHYTIDGKLDSFGNQSESLSIRKLIAKQPDFQQQETLLQSYCKQLGVLTDRSPVAHPEITGEGIEFDWGCSKLVCRSKPLPFQIYAYRNY